MLTRAGGRHRAELQPEDHEALRSLCGSVAALTARQSELVLAIHQGLLVTFPAATQLPGAGRPVARRLATALLQAATVDDRTAGVVQTVRRAAAENRADGLGPERADLVAAVMLEALEAVHRAWHAGPLPAGPEWTVALAAAWNEYVTWLRVQWSRGAARDH